MSRYWNVSADVEAFDESIALDATYEPLPQYDDDLIPDLEDSWLSVFMVNDGVLSDLNGDFHIPFDTGVASYDINTGYDASGFITSSTPDLLNANGSSFGQLGFPPNQLIDDSSERVNIAVTGQEEESIVPAVRMLTPPVGPNLLERGEALSSKRNGPQNSAKRSTSDRTKFKRTKIPDEVRTMLDAHFNVNPYPTDGELTLLSGKSGLLVSVIRTWFINARSRKQPLDCSESLDVERQDSIQNDIPRALSSPVNFHNNSVEHPDRCSPAPSTGSLERYLAAPTSEEAIPAAIIEAALQCDPIGPSPYLEQLDPPPPPLTQNATALPRCDTCKLNKIPCSGDYPVCIECNNSRRQCFYGESVRRARLESSRMPMLSSTTSRESSPVRGFSVMGSESSVDSNLSHGSFGSLMSVSSRASRRGRKRWRRPPTPPSALRRKCSSSIHPTKDRKSGDNTNSSVQTPYFCTEVGCDKSFQSRYEWARHEEAVHYWPYHWICCLDLKTIMRLPHCFVCGEADILLGHLAKCQSDSCAGKSEEIRIFWREDQLSQHIKRRHMNKTSPRLPIPKKLLSAWRIHNPFLSASSLHCGFCGMTFDTWSQRQDHVFDHLKHRICKSAWWPGRLPVVPTSFSSTDYTCSACCCSFPSIEVAFQEHAACATYSCRYLHDWHAMFASEASPFDEWPQQTLQCRLCDFKVDISKSGEISQVFRADLREHADSHQLRACDQEIFIDKTKFHQHMRTWHGALRSDGTNWHIVRFLESADEGHIVRTWLELQDCPLCDTKPSKAHGVCSVATPMDRTKVVEVTP